LIDLKNWRGQIVFTSQHEEEEVFHDRDLIQLHPYGLSFDGDPSRPFLLLKDETHEVTLPVAVNPLEAGVTLTQNNRNSEKRPLTPHKFSHWLLESLDIQIVRCVFVEIKGLFQYVRLYMVGHPKTNSVKLRADEAMSLCLLLNVPIFATRSFIGRSRVMATESGKNISEVKSSSDVKSHSYYM